MYPVFPLEVARDELVGSLRTTIISRLGLTEMGGEILCSLTPLLSMIVQKQIERTPVSWIHPWSGICGEDCRMCALHTLCFHLFLSSGFLTQQEIMFSNMQSWLTEWDLLTDVHHCSTSMSHT